MSKRKKNRKKKNKRDNNISFPKKSTTVPQIISLPKDNGNSIPKFNIKKNPFYKSGIFLTIFLFLLSIPISYYFFFLNQGETQKSTTEIKQNTKEQNDRVIEEFRKNSKLFLEQLGQQVTKEEYEIDKKNQDMKIEEFKELDEKSAKEFIDSVFNDYKIVIQNINYISGSRWSELFNDGYGIFKIGTGSKLFISQGNFKSPLQVAWNEVKLRYTSDDEISFDMPTVENKEKYVKIIGKGMAFTMNRGFESLNKIYSIVSGRIIMYAGIIADNESGIIGIIGFSNDKKNILNEKLIDFDNLQKFTGINFNKNIYN